MKKNDWEDIKVNKRSTDKPYFESSLLQNISDSIDFLKDEADELLKELDSGEFKQQFEELSLENISNDIDDVIDEVSQLKSELIDEEMFPEFVRQSSRDTKAYLNRDADYVRRAKRKLGDISDDDRVTVSYRKNIRIIELCDKAIYINSSNKDAYCIKAQALINLEKYEEAIEELINALVLNGDDLSIRCEIANANRLNGDLDDAISVYDSVLKVDGESFEALKGKAYVYADWGDGEKACEFFKKANSIQILDDESKALWDGFKN